MNNICELYQTFYTYIHSCYNDYANGVEPIMQLDEARHFINQHLEIIVQYMIRKNLYYQLLWFEKINSYPTLLFVDCNILSDCIQNNSTDIQRKIMIHYNSQYGSSDWYQYLYRYN